MAASMFPYTEFSCDRFWLNFVTSPARASVFWADALNFSITVFWMSTWLVVFSN